MEATEVEEDLSVLPSFIPISRIPSLSFTDGPSSHQATGLPSAPLNALLPSFSEISGISSP